jgi:hypothetical protein
VSRAALVAATLVLLFAPLRSARAQSWDASLLAGYTPSVNLDRQAPEIEHVAIRGGFTWGAEGGYAFTPRWTAEALWMWQQSAQRLESAGGHADLFTFSVGDLHGDVLYHFAAPDAKLRPFVLGGLGATLFRGGGLPSDTKLSWVLGGGAKYFPWPSIGFRGQVRYKPVALADKSAGDFCDPFGFCQSWLNQFDLTGGVIVRF